MTPLLLSRKKLIQLKHANSCLVVLKMFECFAHSDWRKRPSTNEENWNIFPLRRCKSIFTGRENSSIFLKDFRRCKLCEEKSRCPRVTRVLNVSRLIQQDPNVHIQPETTVWVLRFSINTTIWINLGNQIYSWAFLSFEVLVEVRVKTALHCLALGFAQNMDWIHKIPPTC